MMHILSNLFYLVSVNDRAKTSEADYGNFDIVTAKGLVGQLQKIFITYTMKFNHGILSLDKALPHGSNFPLDIELYLLSPAECLETIDAPDTLADTSYQLANVSYNMKLVKLDESLIWKCIMIMSSNNEIVLPHTAYKDYVLSLSSISQRHFFHNSCTDIQKMFTVCTAPNDTFINTSAEP